MQDNNPALESLTAICVRLQELLWRSPIRKKFAVAFIADMLLCGRKTNVAISMGRRMINEPESVEFFQFALFCRDALKDYRGGQCG